MNEVIQVLTRDVFTWIVPEIILVAAACVIFIGGTIRAGRDLWGIAALLSLALAGAALAYSPPLDSVTKTALYTGPVTLDRLALLFKVLSLAGGAILVLISWNEVPESTAAEYQACLLTIVAGMCLTGAANDLITLFLALELISIPTYVLLYLPRRDNAAQEAAMKYFLLSIFSSALLLFGFSYLYGLAGTINLPAIAEALTRNGGTASESIRIPGAAMAALVLVVAGLGFRLAVVPFHFYAPDVYQGMTNSAAALLAYVPKVAGVAGLVRVLNLVPLVHGGPDGMTLLDGTVRSGLLMGLQVSTLLWIIAAVSMTLGNLLALLQNDLRRLLAYSSIAHAGYMLIGLAAAPHLKTTGIPGGVEAVLFYLIAYGAMTVGAFAIIGYLNTPERPVETVDDLGGLIRSHPALALLMGLFLFSLIGIPPTAGFFGKFFLLQGALGVPSSSADPSAMDTAYLFKVLALITAINAAIGAWYYLRIAAVIFLRNPLKPPAKKWLWPNLMGIGACAVITLVLGILSWPAIQAAVNPVAAQQMKR